MNENKAHFLFDTSPGGERLPHRLGYEQPLYVLRLNRVIGHAEAAYKSGQ